VKRTLFFVVLAGLASSASAQYTEPPDVPAVRVAADFPLRLHIFGVRWNRVNGFYEGYGRADLMGAPPRGVDYTFSCAQPFLHNAGKGEFYQARWKKENQRIEILMQKVGSDKEQKCELKTSVKTAPYGLYNQDGVPAAKGASPPQ
jgi:hypothetical protein